MEQTEKELWQLFKSIDRDHNGQLDKAELRAAFVTAGISLPGPKLDQFFSEIDSNKDGVISFDEWRCLFRVQFVGVDGLTHDQRLSTIHSCDCTNPARCTLLLFFNGPGKCRGGRPCDR